jgi:hypothetical protein
MSHGFSILGKWIKSSLEAVRKLMSNKSIS